MDRIISPPAIHGEAEAGRSAKVIKRIDAIKTSMGQNRWELAELYSEAHEKSYHFDAGYENFDTWVDETNPDWSAREARYHIRINNHSKKLGLVPRTEYPGIKISKLKQIFTLDPDKHGDDIKRLVTVAKTASLDHITAEVNKLKGIEPGEEMTFRNFYVLRTVAEGVIDKAVEEVKLEAGGAENADGESEDISDGRALELICTEWMQDPNRARHQIEADIAAGEESGVDPEYHDAYLGDDDVPTEEV